MALGGSNPWGFTVDNFYMPAPASLTARNHTKLCGRGASAARGHRAEGGVPTCQTRGQVHHPPSPPRCVGCGHPIPPRLCHDRGVRWVRVMDVTADARKVLVAVLVLGEGSTGDPERTQLSSSASASCRALSARLGASDAFKMCWWMRSSLVLGGLERRAARDALLLHFRILHGCVTRSRNYGTGAEQVGAGRGLGRRGAGHALLIRETCWSLFACWCSARARTPRPKPHRLVLGEGSDGVVRDMHCFDPFERRDPFKAAVWPRSDKKRGRL